MASSEEEPRYRGTARYYHSPFAIRYSPPPPSGIPLGRASQMMLCGGARRSRSGHIRVSQSPGGSALRRENGVNVMTMIKSREPAELDKATESAVEGEIREFVRRDVATLRRSPEADSEVVANNISTLLQRVAGSSVQEIDRLMGELHTLRELLQAEGARVQREITEYAHLSQSAMQSTKVITESLAKWKGESAQRARG